MSDGLWLVYETAGRDGLANPATMTPCESLTRALRVADERCSQLLARPNRTAWLELTSEHRCRDIAEYRDEWKPQPGDAWLTQHISRVALGP